jgi:hypothetical protein
VARARHLEAARAVGLEAAGRSAFVREVGYQQALADAEQMRIEGEPLGVLAARRLVPVELRALEGLGRVGVRNALPVPPVLEAHECRELAPAAFAHRARQLALEVTEVQEGRARGELLSHEEQRDGGGEQLCSDRQP